jgi:2-oxoglutarate dehydrogenase E1 component
MDLPETLNAEYIDKQYQRWKKNQHSVSRDWQFFFRGFEMAGTGKSSTDLSSGDSHHALKQARVTALIYRYRDLGHLLACMDPLSPCPTDHPLLNLNAFNLSPDDLDKTFYTPEFSDTPKAPLRDIINELRETYCRSIGVEYMHLQDPEERRWLQDRMEPHRNRPDLNRNDKAQMLKLLLESSLFEQFLNKKYIGITRFSLEGGDVIIPLLSTLIEHTAINGCREIILGTAHRGRLNIQAHILNRPYEEIFEEFESCYDPDQLMGTGDVKYHNGYIADINTAGVHPMRIFLVNNPSHLEAVDPVVEGITRARQDMHKQGKKNILPILLHGDAAFAGQGVVFETLNMSQLSGYQTGGTIHIVINNQIGYTTLPEDARSTRYSTDVAKMLMVPIFHVHGEKPEAVVHAARLAADYRNTFHKDVVIDVICYRRFGHNEGDEPYFTQPTMYDRIRTRPSLDRLYADHLLEEKTVSKKEIDDLSDDIQNRLEAAYQEVHNSACAFPDSRFYENWNGFHGDYSHQPIKTAVTKARLVDLSRRLNQVPDNFNLHPKLKRLMSKRMAAVKKGAGIDWANAEALSFASLVSEGVPIRLSGQDVARGTFSQRHSVWTDIKTGKQVTPLSAIGDIPGRFAVYNSHLSEVGVLGFEYGYALAQPHGLTIWEAQFGDFVNNAQATIDLFIASGESKWQRLCGLVMLLPHGLEGLGPEHSSARLERFLQLCAEDNIQVCYPTTPAQYFHLLRRQIKATFRKPLVIMSPKSLLRHPLAVSNLSEMTKGSFQTILDDPSPVEKPNRVLFCSGKIFYQLVQRRQEINATDRVIIRAEQLYPFPGDRIKQVIRRYKTVNNWAWVQEEPKNMGAWAFIRPRLEKLTGKSFSYIGRAAATSPASGFPMIYKQNQAAIIDQAIGKIHENKIKESS